MGCEAPLVWVTGGWQMWNMGTTLSTGTPKTPTKLFFFFSVK
jgi:hypothetical protein